MTTDEGVNDDRFVTSAGVDHSGAGGGVGPHVPGHPTEHDTYLDSLDGYAEAMADVHTEERREREADIDRLDAEADLRAHDEWCVECSGNHRNIREQLAVTRILKADAETKLMEIARRADYLLSSWWRDAKDPALWDKAAWEFLQELAEPVRRQR